jgi:hypothetical protein
LPNGSVAEYTYSLVSVACGARQEYPAGDPEVFPYGVGTIRAVHGAELLEREAELRVLETLVTQAAGGIWADDAMSSRHIRPHTEHILEFLDHSV